MLNKVKIMDKLPVEMLVKILGHVLEGSRLWLALPLKDVSRLWHHVVFNDYLAAGVATSKMNREEGCTFLARVRRDVVNDGACYFRIEKRRHRFALCLVRYKHFQLLGWARAQGCLWTSTLCSEAARVGDLCSLQWLRENGCPWDTFTCADAAAQGHFKILKWAHEQGCPWNEWTCTHAAAIGDWKMLEWAHEQSCPWDEMTCAYIAKSGHLKMLQWARSKGCQWNEWTCTYAVRGGHLEILKWARKQGCPWHIQDCTDEANWYDYKDISNWIETQQCDN